MKRFLVLILLLCSPTVIAGENAAYIPAYNELARMVIDRFEIVGEPINLPLKDPASTDPELNSVLQRHMNYLRALVHVLIRDHYVPSGPVDSHARKVSAAFPRSAAHIMGKDIGQDGVFTSVPGKYSVSGQTRYANELDDTVPLLWIHFMELYATLKQLRFTIPPGSWSAEGEANYREGQEVGLHGSFADAKIFALDKWNGNSATTSDNLPRAFTRGKYDRSHGFWSEGYTAMIATCYGYRRLDNLPAREGVANFYSYAGAAYGEQWSDFGATVAQGRWHVWDSQSTGSQSSLVSKKLGSAKQPSPWCEAPDPGVGSLRALGYFVGAGLAHVEWTDLYEKPISSPETRDTAQDGIVDTGCDKCTTGKCLPKFDHDFDSKFTDGYIKWPLGLSSGLTNGNIRVKAYIAERYAKGEPRQCFSLDTRVDRIIGHSSGEWTFAEVVRPSGVRVLFALTGDLATQPVTAKLGYTLHRDESGYELRFPDDGKTVHRFNSQGSLIQVRRTVKNHELTLNGTPSSWPGLSVLRNAERVDSASTSSIIALCYGWDDVVTGVRYLDKKTGTELHRLGITPGSRILRDYDGLGNLTYESRIYNSTNGSQETWHDVTTNGVLSVAKKTVRTQELGPDDDEYTILHTEILHPDTAHEARHVTASVFSSFAWGNELVARVVGWGTPSAQTNRYHYHEDASDTNCYSRLRLVEYADGSWTRYDDYDARGRPLVVAAPFNDAPPMASSNECRITRYTYIGDPTLATLGFPADDLETGNDHRPRLVVQTALGQEVSRTYHAYTTAGHIAKRCITPGAAYTDPASLVTTSSVYTDGVAAGRPAHVEHPDGRLTTYTYAYQADPERLTTTQRTGAHDGVSVTNGTETTRVIGSQNELHSLLTRDIASGLTLSHTAYTRDAFGRTLAVSNLLTGAVSHNTLGCCGLESATDEDGTTTTYTYGNLRQLDQSIRLGVTNVFFYDVQGNTVRRGIAADGRTHWTDSAFDVAGRATAVTNPLGHATHYAYARTTEGGEIVTTTFADGSTRVATSYRDGRPKTVSGSAAHPRAFDYGVGPDGTWEIEYLGPDTNATEWIKTVIDRLGRVATIQYADGHTISNRYDSLGRQVAVDDGTQATLTEYDDSSAPFRSAVDMDRNGAIDLAGADRITETHTRVTTHQGDPVRETTSLVYPEDGNPTALEVQRSLTSLDGRHSWSIAFGRTNHTHIVHDRTTATRTVIVTAPDGTHVVNQYKRGQLMSVTRKDSLGVPVASQTFTYDALGRIKTSTEKAANGDVRVTTKQYDPSGNLTNVTVVADGLAQTTSYAYDAMDRRTRTVLPDGGVVTSEYNQRGELIANHGARVYPTRYTYTDQGHLATLSTYRSGIDGPGDVTSWLYHPQRGWLTAKVYPDGEGEEYAYTPTGQLKRKIRARGVAIDYTYDPAGDLAAMTYSDDTPSVQYDRDRLGRAVHITDAIGTRTNTYEELGRLVQTTQPQTPGAALHYQYDLLARLTNTVLKINGSPVHNTAYTRDTAGRIGTVSGPGVTAHYQYGRDGVTVTNLTFGSSLTTRKTHDSLNRLIETRSDMSDGSTRSFAYTYNQANQRTTATTEDGSAWYYEYDDLGQLTRAHHHFADGTPIENEMHDYDYDTIGNRKTVRRGVGAKAGESIYAANALNQYTQRTIPGRIAVTGQADPAALVTVQNHPGPTNIASRHADYFWHTLDVDNSASVVHTTNIIVNATLTQIENGTTNHLVQTETRSATLPKTPEHFTHDPDGNLLSVYHAGGVDATWTYTWNAENRLTALSNAATYIVFTYDYQGRRTTKTVYDASDLGSPTTDFRYIYDGWNIISEISDHGPAITTNNYTYGLDLSGTLQGAGGVGGALAMTRDTNTYLYCFDGNGNVVNLVDASDGSIAATYEYSPFGQPLRATGPMAQGNPVRWSTKHTDDETDLVMYEFRPYSPTLGRWLSRDPIGEWGGVALYAFVRNRVTDRVDPWGLLTNDPGEFGWDVYSPDFGQQEDAGTAWDNLSLPEFAYPFLLSPVEYLNYKRNDILSKLCAAEEEFVGRDDIPDREVDNFVEDYGATWIEQRYNLFHQRKEDRPHTRNLPEKFINYKLVWGRLPWQRGEVTFKPCELILRKNGCWKSDGSFEEDGTWSYEDTSYARGTHNFAGDKFFHGLFDVLPWLFTGTAPDNRFDQIYRWKLLRAGAGN